MSQRHTWTAQRARIWPPHLVRESIICGRIQRMADKAAADSRPEAGIARMPAALPGAGGDGGGDAKDGKDGPAVSGRRQRRQDQHRLLPRWIVVVGVVTSLV